MPLAANAPYAPRSTGRAGSVRSFALAFAIHGLLFAFLYFGIRWQSRPPATIEAELWSEPPRPSAPAVVTAPKAPPQPPKPVVRAEPRPEPAPPKPDIAVKEEKKKPEPKKEVREKPNDEAVKAALMKEEVQKDVLSRATRELATAKSSSAESAANQRRLEEWADRVRSLIRKDVKPAIADAVPGNPEAVFEVKLLPGPRVGTVRKIKSSGNLPYDEAAQRAIEANERLPIPPAGVTLDSVLILKMRPKDQ
jgi:colicin import membrane protein